jgi:ubiquinone/menaquinone biosynthesis C-methylase UbiE
MSGVAFTVMRTVMSLRKQFRDLNTEVSLAGINVGDRVLDFGCGLGYNTISAAMKVGIEGRVIAQDVSPRALRIVRKKAVRCGLRNIDYTLSDCHTGQDSDSTDIVYLHNTLPMVKDKKAALKEIARILKPGGKLSYMSRTGSRIYGNDDMSDEVLSDYLFSEHQLTELIENKGHIIFEKEK